MGKTIKETLDVMSKVKITTEPKVREKKEHSRDGKTLRQLRNAPPSNYKPEKCSNCGCVRKTPCLCQRKAQS